MPASFHTSRIALDELVEHAHSVGLLGRNEATTRLQLIDSLLFDVLGWSRDECVAEERYEGKYTDYALGVPVRRLIVEAKREGATFELPAGQRSGVVPLRTLLDDGPLAVAIRQALGYAQERGVPFVAIANGHQIVALIASRQDGIPPLEGRALVFTSLEDMQVRFRQLWDNLSRDGVTIQELHRTLKDTALPVPPPKLSEHISGYPRFSIRNRLQSDLQILGDLFLEDLFDADQSLQEDFLRNCYSQSGALSQYALISKEILRTRYSTLLAQEAGVTIEPASSRESGSHGVSTDLIASAMSRRPIVLLGDVGVGKTIFIRNLIHVAAKDVFGEAITLYVNFLDEPAVADDLDSFVAGSIARQLLSKYEIDIEERNFVTGVYHGELQRFDVSVLGQLKEIDPGAYERERIRFLHDKVRDVENHLRSSLDHVVKARKKQVVIFLDNIDQRPSEFQEQVYVMAHAMAASWPVTVFVSLRPSTFFASKRHGSLSAYQPRVFAIPPPRIDTVLKRRIAYSLSRLEDSDSRLFGLPENVDLRWPGGVESLKTYLRVLLHSFEVNAKLNELVDNLSGGNVRRALEFVQTFVGSGNLDTEKILDRAERFGAHVIAVHQFLRAILLGDYRDYSADVSRIPNIFDLLTPDGHEHFIVPMLLSEIRRLGSQAGDEGYVAADSIYSFGQGVGFNPVQVAWALDRAVQTEMIERRPLTPNGDRALFRMTSIGAYCVQRLPKMFAYLDAIVIDTPIVDGNLRAQIHDVRTIDERLARAELFRVYLDKQWNGLSAYADSFNWPETSDAVRSDIWRIGRTVAGWP